MSRLSIGLGALILIAVVAGGVFFMFPSARNETTRAHAAQTPGALTDPFGELRNKKDVGEEHYILGRYPEAVAYWTAAAAKGDAYAAFRLGIEYMDGKPWVVTRDYAKAQQYHLQAARAGFALSMFDLGSMFEFGQGIEKSLPEAARWYGHAANYGLAQGQYNFATMLEAGEGVNKDEVEALKFYVLAARNGFTGVPFNSESGKVDQDAATPAQMLERRVSRAQSSEAHARADAFAVLTGPLQNE